MNMELPEYSRLDDARIRLYELEQNEFEKRLKLRCEFDVDLKQILRELRSSKKRTTVADERADQIMVMWDSIHSLYPELKTGQIDKRVAKECEVSKRTVERARKRRNSPSAADGEK